MPRNDKNVLHEGDVDVDANPDPITGQPGAHPVGTGVGAAAVGAAAGAGAGLVAGPVGVVPKPLDAGLGSLLANQDEGSA